MGRDALLSSSSLNQNQIFFGKRMKVIERKIISVTFVIISLRFLKKKV